MRQLAHRHTAGAAAVTRPIIALTIGDPNGVGPEIAIKAAAKLVREGGPAIILVGDEFVVRFYAELCAKDLAIRPLDGAAAGPEHVSLLAVNALPREAFSPRSEEHTSELQSLTNLVCRLLLEKKKNKGNSHLRT